VDLEIFVIAVWLLTAAIGAALGATKGRSNEGFALGLLLGPIGLIIALLLPAKPMAGARRCPLCRETVADDATVCPHCQREIGTAFNVTCASCGRGFNIAPSRLGHVARCPRCKAVTPTTAPKSESAQTIESR